MRYSPEASADIQKNLSLVTQELQDIWISLIYEVAPRLKNERAKEFLLQGVSRRLNIIQGCIRNIFRIFPVERTQLLNEEERADVAINLHAFLINIHGVPDNLAWAYLLERGINLAPKQVGLFNQRHTQPHLPQEVLAYLKSDGITKWHGEYAKNFRDALAHRIPPYIAPAVLTPEQEKRHRELGEQILVAAKAGNYNRAFKLTEEQEACGSICLAFSQSFSDKEACAPVILHAQIIVDARTVMQIITMMRPHL